MCGIIGYLGTKRALPILLEGLKRLEYRGYDSAGLSIIQKNKIFCYKKQGRVAELEKKLSRENIPDTLGIAHTRWATHGIPSDTNAHPHHDCQSQIYIAHNGIIENYRVLREQLIKEGHKFYSETDSEILAHLVEKYYQGDLKEAVRRALNYIEGAYGLVAISFQEPDKIVAARLGSPIVIGVINNKEYIIASDVTAIIKHTQNVIYLEDKEIITLSPRGHEVSTVDNQSVSKSIKKVDWDITQAEKGGYEHYLIKEIIEQPRTIKDAIRGRLEIENGLAHMGGFIENEKKLSQIKRIIIVACGSAFYAGMVGEYMLEEYAGISTEVELGSEFRYRKPILDPETAVLVISQSGETADTIFALKEAKRKGTLTVGIINVVGSTLAREVDLGVYTHAGPEISVATTKAFTSQIAVLALATIFLGRQRGMSPVMGKRIGEELNKMPKLITKVLEQKDFLEELAQKYFNYNNFLYLGRKYNYPIALEGALKLKEISYIHAEGYTSGEMKHGPITLVSKDFPTFIIIPQDSVYEKNLSNLEEIRAREGKIIALTNEGNEEIKELADDVIYIPKTLEMLTPILSVIPLQLFAYFVAKNRGCDIDKPKNLAKSVTVE